jgi:hypothetical protein
MKFKMLVLSGVVIFLNVACKERSGEVSIAKEVVPKVESGVTVYLSGSFECIRNASGIYATISDKRFDEKPLGLTRCYQTSQTIQEITNISYQKGERLSPKDLTRQFADRYCDNEFSTSSPDNGDPWLDVTCEIDGAIEAYRYKFDGLKKSDITIPPAQIAGDEKPVCGGGVVTGPGVDILKACEVKGKAQWKNNKELRFIALPRLDDSTCQVQGVLAPIIGKTNLSTDKMTCYWGK